MTERISNEDKEAIAYLIHVVNFSIGIVADITGYSKQTICNHKNYNYYKMYLKNSILGKKHRWKRRHLSADDKEIIAFLYQKRGNFQTINNLADILNISARSFYRHKGYWQQSIKRKKPTIIKTEKFVDYWESKRENMIKKLVDDYRKKFGNTVNQSDKYIIQNKIRRKFYDQIAKERKTKFSDLPEYKGKDPEDIILDLTDIVFDILQS